MESVITKSPRHQDTTSLVETMTREGMQITRDDGRGTMDEV